MNQPKTSPLFKAVNKGDVAGLRKLLAAGESVEAQDHERMTPLMRAAKGGFVEAFHLLVEAGADVDAIGMGQTDVLEMAASGGNVEVIRWLIEKGLPLEGHWQPRSEFSRRTGHMTPLLCAAIEGNVEAVRVLLDAGADRQAKYDGQTALQIVKEEIKFPTFSNSDEEKAQYQAIAALLAAKPVRSELNEDASVLEVAHFAKNAERPADVRLHQLLQERCGNARSWKPLPDHGLAVKGVNEFTLQDCKKASELKELLDQACEAECHLVLTEPWMPGEDAKLVLFPTNDKFAVIAATGTEGANYSVQTADVISWLREVEKENPFVLRYCSHDMVGGDFTAAVKGVKKVAERMVELCPGLLDEGFETVRELANAIKKQKSFLVRWD